MPPKRKKAAASADGDKHVWVLTMEEYCHSLPGTETKIIGVYKSKEAAVSSAGGTYTSYGVIEEAAGEYDEGDFLDYRGDPPDDGILLQLFGPDIGEGDYVRILIKQYPLLGTGEGEKKQKKGR